MTQDTSLRELVLTTLCSKEPALLEMRIAIINAVLNKVKPLLRNLTIDCLGSAIRLTGARGGGKLYGHTLYSDLAGIGFERFNGLLETRGFFFQAKPRLNGKGEAVLPIWGLDRNAALFAGLVTLRSLVSDPCDYSEAVDLRLAHAELPLILANDAHSGKSDFTFWDVYMGLGDVLETCLKQKREQIKELDGVCLELSANAFYAKAAFGL